jgi:hypothetical protein
MGRTINKIFTKGPALKILSLIVIFVLSAQNDCFVGAFEIFLGC